MSTEIFSRGGCRAALGATSAAVRAERVLREAGISCEVIALSPQETRRGCAFGIEFACGDEARVRAVLRAARITVSQYLKKSTP